MLGFSVRFSISTVRLWHQIDLRLEAPPVVEESDHSDTVVLFFLLVSKCLTLPFPPQQRGSDELSMYNSPTSGMSSISGEFVPTTIKLQLATDICLGGTDSNKRTSHHLTAGNHSVFNTIRVIDTEQNHHFLMETAPQIFSPQSGIKTAEGQWNV